MSVANPIDDVAATVPKAAAKNPLVDLADMLPNYRAKNPLRMASKRSAKSAKDLSKTVDRIFSGK